MRVDGPHDLPDFRLWLIEQWKPDGEFSDMARFSEAAADAGISRMIRYDDNGEICVHLDPVVERRSLPRASLWWVTAEMAQLIDHAASTLPPTTLTDDLLPDDHGLVAFATPLQGISADTGDPVPVDAISWCRGRTRSRGTSYETVAINSYHYVTAEEINEHSIAVHVSMSLAEQWAPMGMSDWVVGADTEEPLPGLERQEMVLNSMSEDRRWLAALWLLASQPLATSTTTRAPRPAARRSQRAQVGSDVRLVNVRRAATPRDDGIDHVHVGGERRGYSHRFIVEGFWRQQACGPNWSQHRPVWVDSFVKGPKDKPLKLRETVKVVRDS